MLHFSSSLNCHAPTILQGNHYEVKTPLLIVLSVFLKCNKEPQQNTDQINLIFLAYSLPLSYQLNFCQLANQLVN